MNSKIKQCRCENLNWNLLAQVFECDSCKAKAEINDLKEVIYNPLDNVFVRRDPLQGSYEEAKAAKMERERAYAKFLQKPPNCS